MAISSDKKRLYVDATNNKGITPWEVAQCIGDYRVTRLGRDIGMLCTSPKINMWAKFKPVRHATKKPITGEQRLLVKHGLVQNTSTYYIEYDRVREGDVARLLDFDGYNHAAVPPIADTSKFNKTISFSGGSSGQIVFEPDDLLANGSEIQLNEIANFSTYERWYVGVMFLNKTTGLGYYHTYEWTLRQIVDAEATAGESVGTDSDAPNIVDNGVYDFYYCLGMRPNIRYGNLTRSMIGSSIHVLCCDATHGHAVIKAVKLGWSYLSTSQPRFYCSYDGSGSAVIGVQQFNLECTWDFDAYYGTNPKMQFKYVVNEQEVVSPTVYTIDTFATSVEFSQWVEIDEYDLINEYEYIVPLAIYGKFATETGWTLMARGTYDIRNDKLLTWDYII